MLSIETGSTKALIFSFYRHNPGISRQAVVRARHSTVFSPYLSELHSQRRRRAERERGLHREKRFLIAQYLGLLLSESVFYCSFTNRFASGYTINLKPESITLPDTGDH